MRASLKVTLFHLFAILFFPLYSFEGLNLDDWAQDFVQEVKQVKIPGHPHAFNPSIVRWQGRLLMSFREITNGPLFPNLNSAGNSVIGLVWLDDNFEPVGQPQILIFDEGREYSIRSSRSEDARLVIVGDSLWMAYSDNREDVVTEGGFRMHIAKLEFDGLFFSVAHQECLDAFEGSHPWRREKNWVPFDYHGHLLFAYSLLPHKILRPHLGTGYSETFASSRSAIVWDWGELRGGTPAIDEEDHYLAFFHSSIEMVSGHSGGQQVPHYFMGAYTFNKEPPFNILQISPEPIIGRGFYEGADYEPYWKPVRVVFPCGLIADEESYWISYGRQDHEIWVVKIDKRGLHDSLVATVEMHPIDCRND